MANDNLELLFKDPFLKSVEEFEQLMEQSDKVFLLGAGCSKCAGLPLTSELTDTILANLLDGSEAKVILSEIKSNYSSGNSNHTIEDYMSELVDLIAIGQRYIEKGVSDKKIKVGLNEYPIETLKLTLSEIKEKIYDSINEKQIDVSIHRRFVKAIHKTLRFGKGRTNNKADYIILNYDTLLEDCLALENIIYVDGFYGGATGWWDVHTFKDISFESKILKPHGSIDWCTIDEDNLPRRIRNSSKVSGIKQKDKILIWPASTKYRETQLDPYAQIFDLIRKALRPNHNEQTILCSIGYRFADSHINVEIENALKDSAGNLTLVIFLGDDEVNETLSLWLNNSDIKNQIRVYSKKNYYHGDKKLESKDELPWWKFENITRLLEGEKI